MVRFVDGVDVSGQSSCDKTMAKSCAEVVVVTALDGICGTAIDYFVSYH